MKKAFTIVELLVAMGLFAAVIAAAGMIFNYSLESQRVAGATAEIMRTLRAITDQLDMDFQGLRTDGYLILFSEQINPPADINNLDALYYFSTGDYQSWTDTTRRSNIARIFLGHSQSVCNSQTLPGNLLRDVLLLDPGYIGTGADVKNKSFIDCQTTVNSTALFTLLSEPSPFTADRPDIDLINNAAVDTGKLISQNVGTFKIEWSDGSIDAVTKRINWYGQVNPKNDLTFETLGPPYLATWTPLNSNVWPKALKFTFTLYDSKGILKGGRTFEHIVYIGP